MIFSCLSHSYETNVCSFKALHNYLKLVGHLFLIPFPAGVGVPWAVLLRTWLCSFPCGLLLNERQRWSGVGQLSSEPSDHKSHSVPETGYIPEKEMGETFNATSLQLQSGCCWPLYWWSLDWPSMPALWIKFGCVRIRNRYDIENNCDPQLHFGVK